MRKDEMTLERFSNVCKKLLAKPLDFDSLNDLYVDYRQSQKHYKTNPGEFIHMRYEDRKPEQHDNWLKTKTLKQNNK